MNELHRRENADKLLTFLTISPFVIQVLPTKYHHLITSDYDDNKFVDCAIEALADYIITTKV